MNATTTQTVTGVPPNVTVVLDKHVMTFQEVPATATQDGSDSVRAAGQADSSSRIADPEEWLPGAGDYDGPVSFGSYDSPLAG
jgi:hypothetical protein